MKDTDELSKYDRISSDKLVNKPLLSHQASHNSEIMSWFHGSGITPNVVATYNLAYQVIFVVGR